MLCLSGFELYSRWVPLAHLTTWLFFTILVDLVVRKPSAAVCFSLLLVPLVRYYLHYLMMETTQV